MENLNPHQQVAVDHVEGPLLVLAGAGSGKTRIVTYRVAHLLQLGVSSSDILAVTFTNKAAAEMRHRILQLTHKSVMTCTFHSLCPRILRESIPALGYSRDFVIPDMPENIDAVIEQTAFTFDEDRTVIEAQFKNMQDFAEKATWTDIHVDVGANRARRIIVRLLKDRASVV